MPLQPAPRLGLHLVYTTFLGVFGCTLVYSFLGYFGVMVVFYTTKSVKWDFMVYT